MPDAFGISAFITIDLHGKNTWQAQTTIDAALRRAKGVYQLRLIHGYRGGTALSEMILARYAAHPAVLRLERPRDGLTVLVLREG